MVQVQVRPGETAESAARRLRRTLEKDGKLRKLRELMHYKKPSKIKQELKKAAIKRTRKKLARDRAIWNKIRLDQERR